MTQTDADPPRIQTPEDAAALIVPRMQYLDKKHLILLILNTRNQLIGEPVEIYHGSLILHPHFHVPFIAVEGA